MRNHKGYGRKRSWHNLMIYWHLAGETEVGVPKFVR
jgi:hypothetical protein